MSLKDKNNCNNDTLDLVNTFLESNQRKRKSLINKIESSANSIFKIADKFFLEEERKSDDWAFGWILQVLKKYQPNFFDKTKYNNWFLTFTNVNIDFDELQLFLLEQKFEEADRLTSSILRRLAGKVAEKRGYVFYSEVKNMSGIDLETIDRLWKVYSQGKFGFSIQAKLLKTVGKRYDLLWPKIGWKIDGIWTRYPSSFCWSLKAPEGHMPLVNQLRGVRLMDSILRHPSIASRHDNCL
mgnify:CR=1 FL=1|tara:strand:- start:244 stop:963 length:720 start_codon:yes stop_codon:yes gene_type:complete